MEHTEYSGFHPTLPEDLRVLKSDDTFLAEGMTGSFPGQGPEGVYHRNCRVIASSALLLDGRPPVVLGDSVRSEGDEHRCEYTNPDGWTGGEEKGLSQGAVLISRKKKLISGGLVEDLRLRNYAGHPVRLSLELHNRPDFRDIFEVRNWLKPLDRSITSEAGIRGRHSWSYQGRDGESRKVTLTATGPGTMVTPKGSVCWNCTVEPGVPLRLRVSYAFQCGRSEKKRASLPTWEPKARMVASHSKMDAWLARSLADLQMLSTATSHGPFPYAGVPWFSALFGRDALITSLETLWLWPELSAAVLRVLADGQCRETDPAREGEPGKILHESRFSERTNMQDLPFGSYYGAVDSTPLYLILAAEYYRRTGDRKLLRQLRESLEKAVAWMECKAAENEHGLLCYLSHNELGLTHQGWRDAEDAIFHPDGRKPTGALALVEAQGYHIWAQRSWGHLLTTMYGDEEAGLRYLTRAKETAQRVSRLFWDRKNRFFHPALDGRFRPTRFLCSSAGHMLWAGASAESEAQHVIERLFGEQFWSGWGVRTVAKGPPYYNPLSYHRGAVWPHDTMLCAVGAAKYGYKEPALRTFLALFDVATSDPGYRLSELFSGLTRQEGDRKPLRFATACSPQAWACAVPFGLVKAMLGLEFSALEKRIFLRGPSLPPELESLEIKGLEFGGGSVDLTLRREDGTVAVTSVEKPPGVTVEVLM